MIDYGGAAITDRPWLRPRSAGRVSVALRERLEEWRTMPHWARMYGVKYGVYCGPRARRKMVAIAKRIAVGHPNARTPRARRPGAGGE